MSPDPALVAPHAIRRQRLEIEVGSETLALALRARLADWNRTLWLPTLERVLDACDLPGRRLRLGRLELDLGTLPLAGLETAVAERLEQELRRALAARLGAPGQPRSLSEQSARFELFEHYLLHGTLPFGWPRASFRFSALVRQLAAEAPRRLAGAIRRHGRRRRVLERLLAQLDSASFHLLLRRIEPEHGALLVAYLLDVGAIHRDQPLLPLGERELERELGLLTLAYLVAERGSRFNRKSYVEALIRGLGRARSLPYAELLRTLGRCLHQGAGRRLLRSSLPEVVAELLADLERGAAEQPALEGLSVDDFLTGLRHRAAERDTLVRDCSPAVFEQVLERLRPEPATELAALVAALDRIPAPYRPHAEKVRSVMLDEVLRAGAGHVTGEELAARVLRRLFSSPPPAPVVRSLERELGRVPGTPPSGGRAAASKPRRRLKPASPPVPQVGETIAIDDAGLVLAGAFLPHFFAQLELPTIESEGRTRLVEITVASRAVHLLRSLVDGRTDAAEPELVLEKILCGWPLEAAVERCYEPSAAETALAERLLAAMIAAWPSLGRASIAALRETFFKREGQLERTAEGWKLRVQRKTVDVLVDQVPWSFSVVLHKLMEKPLHVSW